MKITLDDARRVAALAALELDDEELGRVARDMSRILDYVDEIEAVDVSAVTDDHVAVDARLRVDETLGSGIDGVTESNAPAMLHGHFVVPKVIGGE